tara:strand:- start:336 stop:485 length:150 start_codon:yes stop_codon:yes gene_type:complete
MNFNVISIEMIIVFSISLLAIKLMVHYFDEEMTVMEYILILGPWSWYFK